MITEIDVHKSEAKGYPQKVRIYLMLGQLILLYYPIVQFFTVSTDNGTIPASACYFFSLVFVPHLIMKIRQLRLPPWYITGFFLFVYTMALVRIPQYGLAKGLLHWVFGLYLLVVVVNVGSDFKKENWQWILETGACVFAIGHLLFMVLNYETIFRLIRGYFTGELPGTYGATLPSLTRGGRNLDATWLALGAFFVSGRKKAFYITYTILFSFLGGSRVGVIGSIAVIVWSLLFDPIYCLKIKRIKWYAVYAVAMLAVLFLTGLGQAFLGRMVSGLPSAQRIWQSVGLIHTDDQNNDTPENHKDPDIVLRESSVVMAGRGAIWATVPVMMNDNAWGHGVGNAMRVMKQRYGFTGYEDVVHNVFLQLLVDEGIIGGLWYIAMVVLLFYSQRKERFRDPLAAYLLTYLILSLVQFHGGEALMYFVLGIFLLKSGRANIIWDSKHIKSIGKALRREKA